MAFFHFNSDDKANLLFNTHTDVALLFLQKLFSTSPPPPLSSNLLSLSKTLSFLSSWREKGIFCHVQAYKEKENVSTHYINKQQPRFSFIYLFIHSCKEKVIKQILPHAKNFRKYRNCIRYIYISKVLLNIRIDREQLHFNMEITCCIQVGHYNTARTNKGD